MKKGIMISIVIGLMIFIVGSFNYENSEKNENTFEVSAVVLETDDSGMIQAGISKIGDQSVTVIITEGKHKGENLEAKNHLMGKLDYDNYYKKGDKIVVAILEEEDNIQQAITVDLYRQGWQMILFVLFVICLILYAGVTGIKALFSFVASVCIIWMFLIPSLLNGKSPLILSMVTLTLLSAIIIFSIAGFTKKGVSAFVGTMSGIIVTMGLTIFFGDKLALLGMTSPFAETLLFSGHMDLNMQHIFYAAIIMGASGAAMDIAMDVCASMEEIKNKKPDIDRKGLIQSGFNVGRAVIGTMTTTLLLAYSGGYLTLLMLFMSKNTSLARMMNLKIVAAEIMRTIVGSIGLVLVAPITALVAGVIFSHDFSKGWNLFEVKKI
ncbi:YibE/F family protein [Marinisporobacter balticus]|uniref:Putative membrane protein n=1 Tax=Marinisporobacter balticus TaxID=2018667 RepID=A0A4R2K8T4_9FIRM|nr:YibE/F family protein [Marinisporobacter balticus]TCO69054.1 putative membrane protein [Marinisporobacter balticus]